MPIRFARLIPRLLGTLLAASVCVLAPLAAAQENAYPSKPVTLIVPAAPGGTSDIVARLLSDKLSHRLGQPVVVANLAGAGGTIGTGQAARATPNGYTLMIGNTTMVISPALYANVGYDPVADFETVGVIGSVPNVLLVHPSFPARTLDEFIAVVKDAPKRYDFASAGNGSPNHLLGVLLDQLGGVTLQHVPYKGTGPAIADVLGNQVPVIFASLPSALPYIKSGQLRALGVSTAKRSPALPEIPAIGERISGYAGELWVVVMTNKSAPAPVVRKLTDSFDAILAEPAMRRALDELGMEPIATPAPAFGAVVRAEADKWRATVKASRATLD